MMCCLSIEYLDPSICLLLKAPQMQCHVNCSPYLIFTHSIFTAAQKKKKRRKKEDLDKRRKPIATLSAQRNGLIRNTLRLAVSITKTVEIARSRPAGTRGFMPSPDAGGEGGGRLAEAEAEGRRGSVFCLMFSAQLFTVKTTTLTV